MKLKHRWGETLRRWLLWLAAIALALVVLVNNWVVNNSEAYVYDNWALLPDNDVGLVLGTSTYTRGGETNALFYSRIQAAVQLWQLGKVKRLIVSGANPDATYNEPKQMRKELLKAGVPDSAISMDYAGFRTLDSIARAKAVFGLDSVTVITQGYHAYRAVFIAKKLDMKVAAYAAPGDSPPLWTRNKLREIFARVKAVLDIYILRTMPKLAGEPPKAEGDNPQE